MRSSSSYMGVSRRRAEACWMPRWWPALRHLFCQGLCAPGRYGGREVAREAQFMLVQTSFNRGDLEGAIQEFDHAELHFPSDPRLRGLCDMLYSAWTTRTTVGTSTQVPKQLQGCEGS